MALEAKAAPQSGRPVQGRCCVEAGNRVVERIGADFLGLPARRAASGRGRSAIQILGMSRIEVPKKCVDLSLKGTAQDVPAGDKTGLLKRPPRGDVPWV